MSQIKPLFENVDSVDFTKLEEVLGKHVGYNQSNEPNMLQARTDAEAIKTFLNDYKSSKLTYRAYLKEIERLALWCFHVPKITISDLKREHIIDYKEFITNPEPLDIWCGPRKAKILKSGEPNPSWRPFASPLSQPTARKVVSILDSFFNYLVQNNYLGGNPMAVDKRRKGKKSRSTDRWLERSEINMVLSALEDHQKANADREYEVTRAKYIILTLFYTGLRIAELTNHTMGNFILKENEWYLSIVGKGQKSRDIVVVDEYLDILISYRKSLGLRTKLPEFGEKTPIVSQKNCVKSLSEDRVWQILKWSFNLGANKFESISNITEEEAISNQHRASKLKKASAHWLRHSYGTYLVKSGCAIEKVKELMGHSDISTTMLYVHIAKNDLHEAARNLSLSDDNNDGMFEGKDDMND